MDWPLARPHSTPKKPTNPGKLLRPIDWCCENLGRGDWAKPFPPHFVGLLPSRTVLPSAHFLLKATYSTPASAVSTSASQLHIQTRFTWIHFPTAYAYVKAYLRRKVVGSTAWVKSNFRSIFSDEPFMRPARPRFAGGSLVLALAAARKSFSRAFCFLGCSSSVENNGHRGIHTNGKRGVCRAAAEPDEGENATPLVSPLLPPTEADDLVSFFLLRHGQTNFNAIGRIQVGR